MSINVNPVNRIEARLAMFTMFKKSLLFKILATVLLITIVGFGVLVYEVIDQERNGLLEERRRASELMAQPILHTIYEDMVDERADMVRYLIEGMKNVKGAERVQIIRSNGIEEAFQDFKTLKAVEKEHGEELKPEWVAGHPNKEKNIAQGINNPRFKEALELFNKGGQEGIHYIEEDMGRSLFTYLVPIITKKKCETCHGTGEEVRGVLMISSSLEGMYAELAYSRMRWIIYGFLTISGVSILLIFFVRGIIKPLRKLSDAAGDIAMGNYVLTTPVQTEDEIGALYESFNKMAREVEAGIGKLRESEARLVNAQKIARLGNWDWDIVNNNVYWSDEIYRIFGLTPQEFGSTYEAFLDSVHIDDREFVKKSIDEALCNKKPYSIDHRIVLPDGTERIVHEEGETTFNEAGRAVRMFGTVQDITESKKVESEFRKLSTAIEQSINIIFITDPKGIIDYVNPMFEQITGWSKEEAVGRNPRILASGETPRSQYEELWSNITSGRPWRYVFKNKKKNGQHYWANAIISPIKNEKGGITHFLAIQEDITEKKRTEERIERLISYDELTGLVNRIRFGDLLNKWISSAHERVDGLSGALLLIDIDEFKSINDLYGHSIGDEFLIRVARLLQNVVEDMGSRRRERTSGEIRSETLKGENIMGRLGGNEFAVFMGDITEEEGMEAAEIVRRKIEGLYFAPLTTRFTVSIGVVFYPEHGNTTREMFTKADIARYRAKELGRNRFHRYRTEDRELEKMQLRLKERERIQKALNDDRFEPWFQPILDLTDNKIHHYEALARMKDENGDILLPGAFIDTAERFGLIGAIDRVIIDKTMKLQAETRRMGRELSFTINLSGKDFGDDDFLSFLHMRVKEPGANPGSHIFEITETAAVRDLNIAIKFIKALKSLGCHFSLDDFGVGFTSFIYLREMEVNYIKIDGSFIRRLHENANDQFFVKAITDVARGMGIKTVAEFVETEETLKLLKKFGVDYAQGTLIGKPAPNL